MKSEDLMKLKSGDKIVCINSVNHRFNIGEIYTIDYISCNYKTITVFNKYRDIDIVYTCENYFVTLKEYEIIQRIYKLEKILK